MKVKCSVGVPLGEENDVQCGCKASVDSSVKTREVSPVGCFHTVASDRLPPVSHSEGQPSCEITSVKSQISALYSVGIRSLFEPSTSRSCIRISRPRRKQKLSHSYLLGVRPDENCERLRNNPETNTISTSTPCHGESTVLGSSVNIQSQMDLVDASVTGLPLTDCSEPLLLDVSNEDDRGSPKRCRPPFENDSAPCINTDSANSCEMPRTLPPQSCPDDSSNYNFETDQGGTTDESREVKYFHTTIGIPTKLHTYNTSSVDISLPRPFISLTPLKPYSVSSPNKTIKFSNSCRDDISRQPLRPISNINRIRLPKCSGVRVLARKDLSLLGVTNHPAARTRQYTPPYKAVGGRKHREYLRLRAMLPAPRRRAAVSKVSVVCEAARHIEQLHRALIRRFRERLPPALAGCGLSSGDVGQRNIRQLVLRVLAACNPGSLPPAPLENGRSFQSPPHRPRGRDRKR